MICKERMLKTKGEIDSVLEAFHKVKKIICQTVIVDNKKKTEIKVCLK
jgi:hypothetical protein